MPGVGGFSWSQVKDIANRRTEQRGASLDLDGELYVALQELCLEKRWWWRRRINAFTILQGVPQYDLTATGTGALNAADMQQIAKNGFKIYNPGTPPVAPYPNPYNCFPYWCPEPVFDVDVQDTIIAMQTQYAPATPCRFFILPGTTNMLVVDPIPDQNYPAVFGYWAVPNYQDDSDGLTIPLLPAWMQPALIKKLESQIERFSQSEEGPQKYEMVMGEYERLLEKAALYRQFADGYVEDLRVRTHHDSVQSTR